MQIDFYSGFSKRKNSTKFPTGSATRTLTGTLKEPCSVMNPVVKIERPLSDAVPYSYTYAYIGAFARSYFVTDWQWVDGLWECHMEEDVLASWKTNIGNTTAYIERCASEYNGAITDRLYPATTNFSTEKVNLSTRWTGMNINDGSFVIGIISQASALPTTNIYGGAVTYYVMTMTQLKSLLGYLLSSNFLDDAGFPTVMTAIQQLSHDVAKVLVNPIQYISSCMWLPFTIAELTDNTLRDIQLGYYDVGGNHAQGYYLTNPTIETYITGNIPSHPQAPTRGKYLNYSPYTRMTMSIQPFGTFPLDTTYCEVGSYLYCPVVLDTITGKATLRVELAEDALHLNEGVVVYETSAMLGVPIQLSQMAPDFLSGVANAVSAGFHVGTAVATGIPSAGDTSLLMNLPTIGNAISSLMPQPVTQGVNGSYNFRSIFLMPVLNVQHFVVVDEDNTECGRPLCAVRQISTLSGYVKCGEATVDYPCFSTEKETILRYLHSGFFME